MKLKLITKDHQQTAYFRSKNFLSRCHNLGIDFVAKNEDITLVHTDAVNVRKNPNALKNKPTILIERFDSANIGHLKELSSPSLLGLWKISKFRDDAMNFVPKYKGRYHSSLIMKNRKDRDPSLVRTLKPIDSDLLDKIEVPASYAHYSSTRIALKPKMNIKAPRSIDVHFCGTTMYDETESGSPISIHRMTCLRALNKIKRIKKLVRVGRPLPKSQYTDSIYNSKIIVSPWGCGEVCYRDFEAMAAGCILLKPDSGFVETWPDIFVNGKTYIPCRPDFKDLEERFNWILKNWKTFDHMRKSNREILEQSVKSHIVAQRFLNLVNKAASRM